MTTTTGGAANVMNWLEEWHQTEYPNLKFSLLVTEAWSYFISAQKQERRRADIVL